MKRWTTCQIVSFSAMAYVLFFHTSLPAVVAGGAGGGAGALWNGAKTVKNVAVNYWRPKTHVEAYLEFASATLTRKEYEAALNTIIKYYIEFR